MFLYRSDSLLVKLFRSYHLHFVRAGKIKSVFAINLPSWPNLQNVSVFEQSFFKRSAKRRSMRILATKIFVPQLIVRVELDQRDRTIFLHGSSQERQADRMISPYTQATCSSIVNQLHALLDSPECVFNGKRVHRQIAKVRNAKFRKWIHIQHRIPGPNNRRLRTDVARAESGSRSVGSSAVKWNTDNSDFQLLRVGYVRQPQKRGNTGEARIGQRVSRLRMWQTKLALVSWHGRES